MERQIDDQAERYQKVIRNKSAEIDAGIIAGVILADYLAAPDTVPEEIEQAFEAVYPNLAATGSFTETIERFDTPESLQGFLAGIKGKLFEVQYIEYLNSGNLPEGYLAELASTANQPGWDVAITGPDQAIVEMLQLKASDSVNYVMESAVRYPDIDIVTTEEVYSQLLLHSAAENYDIINSGITEDSLAELVETAADFTYGASGFMDTRIPIASLALIAFSSFSDKQKTLYAQSYSFGDRSAKTMIALYLGGFVSGFTTWWVGLLGAVGSRYIADRGRTARLRHKQLKQIVATNEQTIKRYAYLSRLEQ